MAGPRAVRYADPAFSDVRSLIAAAAPDRPERLAHPMFAEAEPCELLVDEIETIWGAIAAADDWSAFHEKLARIEGARIGWGLSPAAVA